jgi:hypothetical protein
MNTNTGRVLKPIPDMRGYRKVNLYRDGMKTVKIARLVALHHIPNPDAKPEVNHKDGNVTVDVATNLDWMTRAENMQHAWAMGLTTGPRGHGWRQKEAAAL